MQCPKCLEDKSPADFYNNRRDCKVCAKLASSAYRANNKERNRQTKRLYYRANKEMMIQQATDRYRLHKPIIIMQTRERERRYRKENIAYVIKRRIGKRIAKVLDGKRPKDWQHLLGYDPSLLVPHLEAQFESWMTWENYGIDWHIDHKRPVSSFRLPEQIRECWALSNLRPLRALDNLKKGSSWLQAI